MISSSLWSSPSGIKSILTNRGPGKTKVTRAKPRTSSLRNFSSVGRSSSPSYTAKASSPSVASASKPMTPKRRAIMPTRSQRRAVSKFKGLSTAQRVARAALRRSTR